MGRRRRPFYAATTIALIFLLFVFASSALSFTQQSGGRSTDNRDAAADSRIAGHTEEIERVVAPRRLIGPGSSPPSCRSKCGRCAPCRAVHVAIQPGLSKPLEYYPEAWRCKCRNNLFMP
uniref:Epidermal patterning factor-like protein n=1 Tax=Kalanchoe fedtschenkoi TaxID=63787 RepID=A0A7N0V9A1_KALFE